MIALLLFFGPCRRSICIEIFFPYRTSIPLLPARQSVVGLFGGGALDVFIGKSGHLLELKHSTKLVVKDVLYQRVPMRCRTKFWTMS